MKKLKPIERKYCTHYDLFTVEECNQILQTVIDSDTMKPALSPGMVLDLEKRTSLIDFIYAEDESTRWIFDRVWKVCKEPDMRLNFLQITEYNAEYGGHFGSHRDTDNFYHGTDSTHYVRDITCVVQLTDSKDYTDGNLLLHLDDGIVAMPRKQGSAIIFPSNTPHSVSRVTKGIRFSLVAWFERKLDE